VRAVRLARRLRALHRCNRMFFHAASEGELLQSICQILASGDELRLAWVGYCEDDAEKTVRPVARAGHGVDFLKQVAMSWGGDQRGRDPAGIAAGTGTAHCIDDVAAGPEACPWRSAAVAHGFASCIAVPLMTHSRQAGTIDLRGALVLYSGEPGAFDESAVEFYAELASCIAHAVRALRGELAGELAHDVTVLRAAEERRRAEDALRKSRIELERVMQMTAMGEMAASIAHEVNQPLGAIVSNGNAGLRWLALASPDLEEARAALKRIVADGHRASEVIAGIRAMFKKGGQLTGPQDMSELVREVLALVRGEVAGQGISVRTELSSELPQVSVSRIQLQQVIANLVMNAVDAMSTVVNRARVLKVKTEVNEAKVLLITVEDSGVGLSICRSIIEIHGGRLTVSAAKPHGAVFQVSLPTSAAKPQR
jgi:signal transduction histidine kinase